MVSSELWFGASPSFYNGVATQSLRFDDGSSSNLTRTFVTPTNSQKWCLNVWVKRGNLGTNFTIIGQDYVSTSESMLRFDSNDRLEWQNYSAGGVTIVNDLTTTQVFRDTSAWYNIHLIFDTVDRSGDDRQQIWVNGEQVTSFVDTTRSSNTSVWNTARDHHIGQRLSSGYYDGYMSEINFVDGLALDPTYFGETKNGVWIAKNPVVSDYGNNGFRLQFNQTGTGADASGIGADTSGNNKHFTATGLDSYDVLPDSPENNFATLNPLDVTSATLSEGNLKIVSPANIGANSSFKVSSGKWYAEFYIDNSGSTTVNAHVIVGDIDFVANFYGTVGSFVAYRADGDINGTGGNATFTTGDIIAVAIDADNGTVAWYKNNAVQSTTVSSLSYTAYTPSIVNFNGSGAFAVANFGQDGSFAGSLTSGIGTATDGNGNGLFKYAPPSSFLALCTSNLSDDDLPISPNALTQADDHFNTVLYQGNGSPAQHTIGFRPNLVWGKRRNIGNQNHWWINDVTDIDAFMSSDNTNDEGSEANGTTFNANGSFTTANNDLFVNNGSNYVVWAWKGNGTGTATSNTSGSINSTVSANTTAGFSIVAFEGNKTKGATVGHGLGVKPDMIIMKNRDLSISWVVWFPNLQANNQLLELNSTGGTLTNTSDVNAWWNNTSPTDTLITLGDYDGINDDLSMVAYCFNSVEGYSKFGSYTGNADSGGDGTFIFLGFRPSFVLIKTTTISGQYWILRDNKRDTFNNDSNGSSLYANENLTEGTGNIDIDFLSNGMKMRDSGNNTNGSGTYIYMAFAEVPFKYALAR